MTMHPLTANDVAKARSEEKLARALEAYRLLDAHEKRDIESERWARLRRRLRRSEAERLADPSAV